MMYLTNYRVANSLLTLIHLFLLLQKKMIWKISVVLNRILLKITPVPKIGMGLFDSLPAIIICLQGFFLENKFAMVFIRFAAAVYFFCVSSHSKKPDINPNSAPPRCAELAVPASRKPAPIDISTNISKK